MKIDWFTKLVQSFTNCFIGNPGIYNPPKNLDFKIYPQLQILKDAGANNEQLLECEKGFYLFNEFKLRGWKDCTKELTEGCLEILNTKKAEPQHFTVFFGMAAYFLRKGQMRFEEISELAKYEASLISRFHHSPKHVQGILQRNFLEYKTLEHSKKVSSIR